MNQPQHFESTPAVLSVVEAALRDQGGTLSAFRSGSGLRVARVARVADSGAPNPLCARTELGYGEHPHVHEALRILADDLRAGGRVYVKVYGPIEPHYFSGSSTPHDALDAWLLEGHTFQARFDATAQTFVVELVGMERHRTPMDIVQRVTQGGETVRWTDERGITRVATQGQFPNGDPSCRVTVESRPVGMPLSRTSMWHARRTGTAPNLTDAIKAAFDAPKVEISVDA